MVREGRTVVNYDDSESHGIRQPGYGFGDVAAAEQEKLRRRPYGLYEDPGLRAFMFQRYYPKQVLGDFDVRVQPDPVVQDGVSQGSNGLAPGRNEQFAAFGAGRSRYQRGQQSDAPRFVKTADRFEDLLHRSRLDRLREYLHVAAAVQALVTCVLLRQNETL